MVNGINSSQIPYAGFPSNACGATKTTKDIASYCYDTQQSNISKTYGYLTSEHKPDYKWPIIGTVTSLLSLFMIGVIKRGRI